MADTKHAIQRPATDERAVAFDKSTAPHLEWASRIKAQHYHLQQKIAAAKAATTEKGTTSMSASVDEDLQQWQETLADPSESERLRDYAQAMHDLATRYWETSSPTATAGAAEASVAEEAHHQPQVGGRSKRPRSLELEKVRETSADAEADTSASQRRQYNDRVRCSMDCVASFYLGKPSAKGVSSTVFGSSPVANGAPETAHDSAYTPLYDTYPLMLSRALKPLRRQFFETHRRIATAAEVDAMVTEMVVEDAAETRGSPPNVLGEHPNSTTTGNEFHRGEDAASGWRKAMHYARRVVSQRQPPGDVLLNTVPPLPQRTTPSWASQSSPMPIYALDVGSCYGPFFGKTLWAPVLGEVPLLVTAIDLCPYNREESAASPKPLTADGCVASTNCRVLKGDWISVRFIPGGTSASEEMVSTATTAGGRVRLQAVPHAVISTAATDGTSSSVSPVQLSEVDAIEVGSYDVAFFCLLLSYLPTARLRYRACLHAYLALKPGGLLVIISTRTQGPRRSRWEEQWVRCLDTIGFTNVHKSTQKKIVVLSFEKHTVSDRRGGEGDGIALSTQADIDAWIEAKMALPVADDGLPIVADGHM